jgi:hypothetical protein
LLFHATRLVVAVAELGSLGVLAPLCRSLSDETLSEAADALARGDAAEAVRVCTAAGKSFFDEPSFITEVDIVLTRTPQVLADCPAHILQPLRIAAGLMLLAGGASIRRFIAIDGDYSYRYEPESVAHLLAGHASHVIRLASLADSGISTVQVLGSGLPEECSTCRKISSRRFTVVDAPELPLVDCTCPDGCKCVLIAVA